MFLRQYKTKVNDLLEVDPVVLEYNKKKEKGEITKEETVEYLKYLVSAVFRYTDMIDKGLV